MQIHAKIGLVKKKSILIGGIFLLIMALVAMGLAYYQYSQSHKSTEVTAENKTVDTFEVPAAQTPAGEQTVQTADNLSLKKKPDGTYEPSFEYVSEVITAHNEFTAIGPVWTASIPAKTDLKIYLNVTGKSGESGWILVERGEGKTNTTAANEYFSEVPVLYSGTSYRFKVVLTTTDKTQTPILEKIRFDLINSLGEKTTWKFPLFGKAEAASSIVSRGAWGCPEATSSPSWPPAYSPVKKIVLHHTASQLNPVDPPADLRAIWYYHARTLGWGDIGYNYLVDQNGRVYEGRFGGANVVAGHTLGFNTGSMGIAMLGDFSGTLPTNATRAALTQLIGEKSFEYGLNPVGADWVYKKDDNGADIPGTALYTSTIDAHRTYGQTSCPGQIYNILGTIRQESNNQFLAIQSSTLKVTSPVTLSNPTPAIGETVTGNYTITNTSDAPVTLNYVGISSRIGGFYGAGADIGWKQNITIAAGDSYEVEVSGIETEVASYSYWAAFVINGAFYYATPQTNQVVSGTFATHVPNIVVTAPLSVSTAFPIAGIAANYKLTVLNREPNRINFSHLGIQGRKLEDMSGGDIYWVSNSYIEPNTTLAIDANVALPSAHYSEWPAMHIGNGFYNIYLDGAPAGRVNVLNFEVPGPGFAHKVTSPVTLSNQAPAIGETITASYEITNTSAVPATLSYVGVTNRLGGFYGAGADIGWKQNITIAAGESYDVNVSTIITEPGTYYYWAAYVLNGSFYYALPQTNQKTSGTFVAHVPNIVVTSPLAVNTTYPIAGQAANYKLTVLNREPNRINFSHLGIMGKRIEDMSNADLYWATNSYVEPNASFAIDVNVALSSAHYSEWPAIHIGNGYYNIYLDGTPAGRVNVLNLEVPGPEYAYKVTSPVTLSNQTPAIGETITASYEITNTSAVPATLSYVGVTNRLGGFYGTGADLGWKQNITIAAGATYPVNVSEIINTPGTYYYWAAYVLNGRMIYALPQTNQKTSGTFATHIPSLVVTSPLTVSPSVPLVGQQTTLAVTITNREPNRINYKRLGIQGFQIPSMVSADFEWLNNSYLDPGASVNISRGWSLAAGQYSEWPAMSFGGGYYNVYRDGAPGSVSVANFTVYEQLPVLDGVSIPATSGLVGREQHLYLNAMEAVLGRTAESAALHYSDSGTPLAAQNGMAGGYGSFGSYAGNNLPVEDERYYINMRWNYVTWYEGADGSCSSNPDGHLDTCTTGASSSLKAWHYRKRVIVTNPATGKRVVASVLESGPAIWTGRVAGLSPEAMLALGANTNDNLTYFWAANQSLSVGPLN